jgi:hypothetical protein
MDIIITSVTPTHVNYELTFGRQPQRWFIPIESMFDPSTLLVGRRYYIDCTVITTQKYNKTTKSKEPGKSYDWLKATLHETTKPKVTIKPKTVTILDPSLFGTHAQVPSANEGILIELLGLMAEEHQPESTIAFMMFLTELLNDNKVVIK